MAGLAKKSGMSPVKRRQMILLLSLVVVVSAIALIAGILGTPSKKQATKVAPDATRKAFGVAGEAINSADYWRTQEGAKLSQLEKELQEMQTRLKASDKKFEEEKKQSADAAERKLQEDQRLAEEKKVRDDAVARRAPPSSALPAAAAAGMATGLGTPPVQSAPQNTIRPIVRVDMTGTGTDKAGTVKPGGNVGAGRSDSSGGKNDSGPDVRGEGNTAETFIPAGSFMRGVLLSGLDAPTGGQSQQNPHPVLIEVMDMASLPNKFRADYKNCRIIADGVGDLSSERAFIRLDRMSCITEDGGAIDIAIKGFVADSSGKNGVRGRLVSKQGSVLANALISGVASGIGNAFASGAMTTSTSPLGTTSTVKSGAASQIQAGVGTGVGTALNELSKYYITLADKMFPIIEVDAGMPVDIVFTKGFSVARRDQK